MQRPAAVILCSLLSACSTLPTSGPDSEAVLASAVQDGAVRYEVVEVTPSVTSLLTLRAQPSLSSAFGDYRPPADLRIGVGDVVSITIWEAAAGGLFSAPLVAERISPGSKSATIPEQVVGRDGALTVPYAGRIRVADQTVAQVQKAIEDALAGMAIKPQVLVQVVRPVSKSVTVTGEVVTGARVPLTMKGDRLLDVIASTGGIRSPVNEMFVQLHREGRTVRVAMARIVKDPRENIYMRPDDVVTLVRDPQKIVAYGATGRNAEIPFDAESMTLAEGLARSGGLLDSRADPAGVFVMRQEDRSVVRSIRPNSPLLVESGSVPVVYRINLRDPNGFFIAQRFPLFPQDIIYVSNSSGAEFQKAIQFLSMLTAPAATGVAITNVVR
jgi:polysaccharide biosynthesis/export protein